MNLKRLELQYVPFDEYYKLSNKELLELRAKSDQLHQLESWLLPQMLSYYGNWKVVTAEGQIDVLQTLKQNIGDDPWKIGLWRVATKLSRGLLVKSQSKPESACYSRLVPIILAGLKQYQGIPYNAWPKTELNLVTDELLEAAMLAEYENFDKTELLQMRELGLTIRSGDKVGQQKPTHSTWKLTGLQQFRVGKLPILAQTMLCQTWVAHPSIRTKYMVLDPQNWDHMPEPLIDSEVIPVVEAKKPKAVIEEDNRLPWEM
jgi:hypothetical protein